MTWLGGNATPSVIGLGEFPGVTNYVPGNDSSAWHTGVSSFERVQYDEVYDGIDLEFYGRGGKIEFDWIVAPFVDPSQITLVYAGMDHLSLDSGGNLVVAAGNQQLVQHAPVVYQVVAGQQREVAGSDRLGDERTVRFELGAYDPSLPLVIDPVLDYSTYFGGSDNDYGWDMAADSAGNTYVIGTTMSSDLAGGSGPDTQNHRAFVAKFTPQGQLAYMTMLGPTPNFDASGYADSVGMQVVVGPDGLPLVSYATTESATLELESGGLLPLPGTNLLHFAKLSELGVPVFDTTAPVLDTLGYFPPYGFTDVPDGGRHSRRDLCNLRGGPPDVRGWRPCSTRSSPRWRRTGRSSSRDICSESPRPSPWTAQEHLRRSDDLPR